MTGYRELVVERMPSLALIAAHARGRVLGKSDGRFGLPWHIPEDLKRFKKLTMGHALIMGRVTFELIGRPLPGRRNIVLSRAANYEAKGVEHANSLQTALAMVEDDPLPFVVGGAQIYAAALPYATQLELTAIDRDVEGDALFPRVQWASFSAPTLERAKTEGVEFRSYERLAGDVVFRFETMGEPRKLVQVGGQFRVGAHEVGTSLAEALSAIGRDIDPIAIGIGHEAQFVTTVSSLWPELVHTWQDCSWWPG